MRNAANSVRAASARALELLSTFLENQHPGFADDAALHAAASARSIEYTTSEKLKPKSAASLAYLAHFGPRAITVLADIVGKLESFYPKAILDVGAGSGAGALFLLSLGIPRVDLLDVDGDGIARARALLAFARTKGITGASEFHVGGVGSAKLRSSADAIVSTFAFGELDEDPRVAFDGIIALAPHAKRVVLVDAGDRAHARRIQTLRDTLVVDGRMIEAPCPHRDPCPALVRERDWCHMRAEKHLPDALARFSRAVGRDDEAMAYSFIAVNDAAKTSEHAGLLVLGEPQRDKGRVRLPVCGPNGVRFVQALKRHKRAHDIVRDSARGTLLPAAWAKDASGDTAHVTDESLT